jgi:hypothetical protein
MAPVKPMGVSQRRDSNPKTRPGVTGFEQDYNEEAPKTSDLNPDAVSEDSVLPPPRVAAVGTRKTTGKAAGKQSRR